MMLAHKITQLRQKNNLSQKELAQQIGVTTGAVAEWESGESVPTLEEISKLSTVFSVSTDLLIKDTERLDDDIVPSNNNKVKSDVKKQATIGRRPFFKKAWFWIITSVVFVVTVVITILLIVDGVKPKVDKDGNPIFVELTDEVYTNASEYLGYYVKVEGRVFQNLGDNGEFKGVQIWLDPENSEQNLMIYYTTDTSLKDGDYIICTGYIKEIHSYTNTYGTELSVPLIHSVDLRSATYIEVMSPTISTITPQNLVYENDGYSIRIDKIEFAEKETRLYLTATNNGKATLYVDTDSSVIIQGGKQYNSMTNYEAGYEVIPYGLSSGTTSSGIVSFPAIETTDFKYTIELHSDDYDEKLGSITFNISKDSSSELVPTISSAIGTYTHSGYTLNIYSDGTLYLSYAGEYMDIEGTWSQSDNTICYSVWNIDGFMWNNPFYDTVYADGIDFLGDYFTRVD